MSTDPYGTEPMFDVETEDVASSERVKAPRTVAWGNCPRCSAPRCGLQRSAHHLTWRWHTYTTWRGTVLPCSASGLHLCDLPEREPYVTPLAGPATCPHAVTTAAGL